MAAPGFVRWYTGSQGGGATVATSQATPAGTPAAGNLLVACVAHQGSPVGQVVSAPGWANAGAMNHVDFCGQAVLTKVAATGEALPFVFNLAGAQPACVLVLEFSGADPALKDGPAGSVFLTAQLNHTGQAVVPVADDVVVYFDQNGLGGAVAYANTGAATPLTWTRYECLPPTGSPNPVLVGLTVTGRTLTTIPSVTWTGAVPGVGQRLSVQPPVVVPLAPPPVRGPLVRS